ncbi:unnamed protein product [marine sediment metagenome]|uniref:Uncharacterized protein n=1 Tax=marine sediment metagenome TaxID=412755 RepID=X1GXZ3_9ZZZZ
MKEVVRLSGFILLAIGTFGLLVNELAMDWGRTATITFAIINLVGFITLAVSHWGFKK